MGYRSKSPFEQLGNCMLSLGMIPVFRYVGRYSCGFFGLPRIYIDLISDVAFITFAILALVASYKIALGKKFTIFRILFLIYLVLRFLSAPLAYIIWLTITNFEVGFTIISPYRLFIIIITYGV